MEIYADKQSDGWIPECLVDWLSDYGNLINGEQPMIYSRLVDFQTDLVNLQEIRIWTLGGDSCWLKKFTITNPEIISISGCLETGEFVGKKNKLVLYDSVNQVVKHTSRFMMGPRIYNYNESLVNLN